MCGGLRLSSGFDLVSSVRTRSTQTPIKPQTSGRCLKANLIFCLHYPLCVGIGGMTEKKARVEESVPIWVGLSLACNGHVLVLVQVASHPVLRFLLFVEPQAGLHFCWNNSFARLSSLVFEPWLHGFCGQSVFGMVASIIADCLDWGNMWTHPDSH